MVRYALWDYIKLQNGGVFMRTLPRSKLTDEQPNLPETKAETAFGLIHAIKLQHANDKQGRLLEVDEHGSVVNDWVVRQNAHAVAFLSYRTVIMPPAIQPSLRSWKPMARLSTYPAAI